jgi:hypothetical protein
VGKDKPREDEVLSIQRWRHDELSRAGYPEMSAWELALSPHVDLHTAVSLVTDEHCPATVAAEILL